MLSDEKVIRTSDDLLRQFFMRIHGTDEAPDDYFRSTFVPPTQFEDLVLRMTPKCPPRLLLWDGQSRVGKTWSAVGAVAALLDRNLVDAVWTAGEDSHLVFDQGKAATLFEAFRTVQKRLGGLLSRHHLRGRVVVLLDDFIGTARLRLPARSAGELAQLASYFDSDPEKNPLLRQLKSLNAALVVIIGRSSVFTSARVRLGLPIEQPPDRVSRGVFQTVNGELIGAVDDKWLRAVIAKHTDYISKHAEFLLPPVAAFANQPPKELTNEPQLPRILFGADLAEFADEVQAAETFEFAEDIARTFDDIYLLYVAPALMYPERAADKLLWESPGSVRALRDALYLHPGVEGVHLRVPNRFYLRAVTDHLAQPMRLALLAKVLLRKLPNIPERHRAVLVRGFIERVLAREEPPPKSLLNEIGPLLALGGPDPLLQWQREALVSPRKAAKSIAAATILFKPGLASALGWSLITFPRVRASFKGFLKAITAEVRHAEEQDETVTTAGDSEQRRIVAVSYSNLLRWFTHDVDRNGHPKLLAELSRRTTAPPSSLRLPAGLHNLIDMVFEDVVIWADDLDAGETRVRIERVPAAKRLRAELRADLESPSRVTASGLATWQLVNRLFSLAWHNDWMCHEESFFAEVAEQWLRTFLPAGVSVLQEQPGLLSVNLQYHWHHMLAQWAVWTRDWCFGGEHSPHRETPPKTCGGRHNHNDAIRKVLGAVLGFADDATDVRNAFFLLGTRAGLLEDSTALLAALERVRAAGGRDRSGAGCLQAIYELARQGFLDAPAPTAMGEPQSVHPSTRAAEFRKACHRYVVEHHDDGVWNTYLSDLEKVTHLDVLPRSWSDVMPADWLPADQEAGQSTQPAQLA